MVVLVSIFMVFYLMMLAVGVEMLVFMCLLSRYSIGKHASVSSNLKLKDFDPKEKFWTRFPPEGSKLTPPHQSVDFRWKDYCPVVFR